MRKKKRLSKATRLLKRAPMSLFWYWINERHKIYLHKESARHKPWTEDRILQQYKFTNVFRSLDKTTAQFHAYIRYHYKPPYSAGVLLFNCAVFRYTGTIDFWKHIGWIHDWPTYRQSFLSLAKERKSLDLPVFTGAYMISNLASPGDKATVLSNKVFDALWDKQDYLGYVAETNPSLQHMFNELHQFPGLGGGGFIAYEIITDMRHFHPLYYADDINTWANPGPGAIRGLRRLLGGKITKENALEKMRHLLELAWDDDCPLEPHVPVLELRDIEHSLCEFDKYCRAKFGEGRPRSTYPGTHEGGSLWK